MTDHRKLLEAIIHALHKKYNRKCKVVTTNSATKAVLIMVFTKRHVAIWFRSDEVLALCGMTINIYDPKLIDKLNYAITKCSKQRCSDCNITGRLL